ncbi:Uncharacterized conserved protein [Ceraceosorus bombacis]|uniref:Uncharacterized conserved protein n=1 Tax=Ceraceosorus bombacis TaxID=401625 RepID=A0A0P1BK24_9BASI|nr:Uncharacterized conserved protein [Ceraceosorus bombacis]
MRWGLLPPSTKVIPKGQDMIRTINARADTILSGRGLWNSPFTKGKRCVVWTQGFYEWLATPQARLPHLIGMPNHGLGRTAVDGKEREMMPLAGLWEECTLDDGTKVKSFAICTTEINKQLEWLHTRMPVILPDLRAMQVWLGTVEAPLSHVAALMRPYSGDLECYRVPQEVGKTGTDDAKFLLPIEQRKDGIARAFGRLKKRDAEEEGGASEQQYRAQLKKVKKEEDREIKTDAEKSGPSAPRQEDAIKREERSGGTLAMKEEERDSILRATEQVERDAQDTEITRQEEHKVDAGHIKRDPSEPAQDQIEADRKFAEELQRSEEPSTANDDAKSKPAHMVDQHRGLSDSEPSAGTPARSSRFSPEPWNPPSPTFGSFDTRASGNGKASQASPTGPTRLEDMLSAQRSAAHSRPGVTISPKSNGASRVSPFKGQAGSPKSKAKDGAAKGAPDIRSFFKQ